MYFAFSISHFVSSVGADAGFAAIIGLAILVLLYFAQARETSTLREEATAASQRVGELERRLAQLGRVGAAPTPRPAPAPAAAPAPAPAAGTVSAQAVIAGRAPAPAPPPPPIPAAPAGVGAPALIDATRMIPMPEPAVPATAAAGPAPPAAPPPMTAAAGPAPPAAPPPMTAAATAAGSGPRTGATASNGTGERAAPRPVAAAIPPPPADPPRPSGAPVPPRLSLGAARRPAPARRWLPALLAALIVAAIVAVLLAVTSGGGGSTRTPAAARSTNSPAPTRASAFNPGALTVAVLNGTDVSELAHRVAKKLLEAGYREGIVATAADQTHASTIVAYRQGFRRDAVRVASALTLPASSVQPADQSAQAVACPPPGPCRAEVIVTVGSDLSSTR